MARAEDAWPALPKSSSAGCWGFRSSRRKKSRSGSVVEIDAPRIFRPILCSP